jgi:hypothetical protein
VARSRLASCSLAQKLDVPHSFVDDSRLFTRNVVDAVFSAGWAGLIDKRDARTRAVACGMRLGGVNTDIRSYNIYIYRVML